MNLISEENRGQDRAPEQNPYAKPVITTLGSVAKLTMGTGSGRADGHSGTHGNFGKS